VVPLDGSIEPVARQVYAALAPPGQQDIGRRYSAVWSICSAELAVVNGIG
jgi:hypothetical protein